MAFKLALAQMLVTGGDKTGNLTRAEQAIAEAAQRGSSAVVLPEVLDLGWTDPSCEAGAEPIPEGEPCRRLSRAAAQSGVYVCAGLTERCDGSVYNAAVLLGPDGSHLCTHRKINELEIGHPYYDLGDRLTVVRTDIGTVGVMICADANARDHVVSRSLCLMGADLILSPCAWLWRLTTTTQTTPMATHGVRPTSLWQRP